MDSGGGVTDVAPVDDAPLRYVSDTRELLEILDLDDVYFMKLSAERGVNDDSELVEGPRLNHEIFTRPHMDGLGIRLASLVEAKDATYEVDIVTEYVSGEPLDIDPATLKDFVERVAIMAAWPYLRSAVNGLCAQMRAEQITLGLHRPGDLQIEHKPTN